MELEEILEPASVFTGVKASGKKQAVRLLAKLAAKVLPVDEKEVARDLMVRERLGSTGVGEGVALPHASVKGLHGVCALFVRLDKPVSFGALDNEPVDLLFVLLAPASAGTLHLRALARISRIMRKEDMRERLRAAPDAGACYGILTHSRQSAL